MDVKVPKVNTLNLKQLLERWPHYSLDNIYELANQGCFGLYVKPLVKKKTTYHINPYLNKLIAAAKKRHEELENYIKQKKELITYFSRYGFLLKSINGYVRLATQKETELFPLTQTSSIQDLIEFNKVDYLDFNNTFGFEGSLSAPQANSYHLVQHSNATRQLPQDYKGYFTDKDLYVLIDQIEDFEITTNGADGKNHIKIGFKESIVQHQHAPLHESYDNLKTDNIHKQYSSHPDNSITEKEHHNLFIKSGNCYEITFDNKKVSLKKRKGLIYLEHLIKNPHRDIYVGDLEGLDCSNLPEGTEISLAEMESAGLYLENGSCEEKIIDDKTLKAIKARINEINEELELANEINNIEKIEDLEEKRNELQQYLNSTQGLGYKPRNIPNKAEKMRKRVYGAISQALESIGQYHPQLHAHLIKTIRNKTHCRYEPDEKTLWSFT
ncbi:hypothetical protein SCS07_02650 [Legionella pneumophila serogroup 1]|nr:hypothetical protein [Legionella pneumophila]